MRATLVIGIKMDVMKLSRRGLLGFVGATLVLSLANKAIAAPTTTDNQAEVRRLVEHIRSEIQKCLNKQRFVQNCEDSRKVARDAVNGFFEGLYSDGHIWDYAVHCDSSNNLENQWAGRRELDMDVYFIPSVASNYIHLSLTSDTGQLYVSDPADEKDVSSLLDQKIRERELFDYPIPPEAVVTHWGIRP